jgi:hypothetical protein
MGKQHCRTPDSSTVHANPDREMAIRREDVHPGDRVSMDQYVCKQLGRLPHTYGKEVTIHGRNNLRQPCISIHLDQSPDLSELEIHFEVNMRLRILPGISESRSRATTQIIIHFKLMSFLKTSNYLIKRSCSVESALTMQTEE